MQSESMSKPELLRFDSTFEHHSAIPLWFEHHKGELGAIAERWFCVMRCAGDEVRELLHDGCPVVCLGTFPFAYVNVFTNHVNVGFFQGASLPDPAHLLQGTGRFMRHVKLKSDTLINEDALHSLIEAAYAAMKDRVEHG